MAQVDVEAAFADRHARYEQLDDAWHLRPRVDRMAELLKRWGKLYMEETTIPVLDPGRGRT